MRRTWGSGSPVSGSRSGRRSSPRAAAGASTTARRTCGVASALSQGVVSFEIEDRAAKAGDELGKVDGFGVAVAHGALPLDHPREQRLAGCHQLVHASAQLRGCLFAGGDPLPGRSPFPPQAHQLLRVALTFRLEEMSL